MSFFNAGYSKGEIEGAAAEVQRLQGGKPATKSEQVVRKVEGVVAKAERKIPVARPVVKEFQQPKKTFQHRGKAKQEVSRYGNKSKTKKNFPIWTVIILSLILLGLLGVLAFMMFY